MEIVVLLKQVPATESLVKIADDGVSIKTDDIKFVMNPYDEIAVEEALRIREAQGGKVTIISVGTDKTISASNTSIAASVESYILANLVMLTMLKIFLKCSDIPVIATN